MHLLFVDVGYDSYVLEIDLRDAFKPHGLPDAGLGSVPDPAPLQGLFGVGVIARIRRVRDDDVDDVFALDDEVCDVKAEGHISARVIADGLFVQKHAADHIDCVKMQEGVRLQKSCGNFESAMIIKHVVRRDFCSVLDAGKQTFGREGHEDLALIALEFFILLQYGVFPFSVEVQKAVPRKLGTGILVKGYFAHFKRGR